MNPESDAEMSADASLDTEPAEAEVEQVEAERSSPISSPPEGHYPDVDAVLVRGLHWAVTDEPNPFHRRLVFSNDGAAVLDLSLDPLLLQDLLASLTYVRDAQRAVLGLVDAPTSTAAAPVGPAAPPVPAPTAPIAEEADPTTALVDAKHPASSADTDTSDPAASDSATLSATPSAFTTFAWWRTHKLLAFLLLFGVVFFIIGSVTSPG